jgi:hypothetical protein
MSGRFVTLAAVAGALASSAPAQAYMGPGLGMAALAGSFGVIGSLILALFAVVWYPVKRAAAKLRGLWRRRED